MNSYEQRKQEKIERYNDLASKNRTKSDEQWNASDKISSVIPFGQPILVGHHSEGRHRRDLSKINNLRDASIESDKKAKYYEDKADKMENNTAINSDDPEAVRKLKEKITSLEQSRDFMKSINKQVKKGVEFQDIPELKAYPEIYKNIRCSVCYSEYGEAPTVKSICPNCKSGVVLYRSYSISNIGANIRTAKKRLEQLEKQASESTTTKEINGVTVVDNVEENRLQLIFGYKPEEEVRKLLKRWGFRFSYRNEAWQRHRGNGANYSAKMVLADELLTTGSANATN